MTERENEALGTVFWNLFYTLLINLNCRSSFFHVGTPEYRVLLTDLCGNL